MARKLSVGIQGFEGLRRDDYIYVDKTDYIYNLVHDGKPYFLIRPRRFGKSLLLSTLKAYWEGKKDLFEGLAIKRLEEDNADAWKAYPVFYFDFNGVNYQNTGALEDAIDTHLRRWESLYECEANAYSLSERFQNLLIKARELTGLRCVVLVDEYDKPLMDVIDSEKLQEHNKAVFKGFFGVLKSFDEYIQFVFITGVSKFHKVSIFSDLNQLIDISLTKKYSGLCGITGDELKKYYEEEISHLADEHGLTINECVERLKKTYDGYRFHPNGVDVYNPYSLLNSFANKEFGSYWFETGTPTFLVEQIKKNHFDIRSFTDRTLYVGESTLKEYTGDGSDSVPLLYQTGYLTIVDYDSSRRRYTLGFPNEEIEYGFLDSLMPLYVPKTTAGNGLDIFTIDEYIEDGNLEKIKDVLTALFANITYTLETDPFEHYFQAVIYLVFTLLGKFVQCEMHTYTGRIDCQVLTEKYIYLFEFKRDVTAASALAQINSNDYALPFVADSRKLYKIGVSFDSSTRMLSGFEVE
ncbi:MAG: AAA family ATPase [Clostridiales bacterium]|nr:AAA family ATPase [Clostridiales bacterium]